MFCQQTSFSIQRFSELFLDKIVKDHVAKSISSKTFATCLSQPITIFIMILSRSKTWIHGMRKILQEKQTGTPERAKMRQASGLRYDPVCFDWSPPMAHGASAFSSLPKHAGFTKILDSKFLPVHHIVGAFLLTLCILWGSRSLQHFVIAMPQFWMNTNLCDLEDQGVSK